MSEKMPGMQNFPYTENQEAHSIRRVPRIPPSDELNQRFEQYAFAGEKTSSVYEVAADYLLDNFRSQARSLHAINDMPPEMRKKEFEKTFSRRIQFSENIQTALKQQSLTVLESEQLTLLDNFGMAMLEYAAKNLHLFYARHNIKDRLPADPSNLITVEVMQKLSELLIRRSRVTSNDSERREEGKKAPIFLNEMIAPLCRTILIEAMGQEKGAALADTFFVGVVGMAAAFHSYSDASLNRFGKSFLVRFPDPYLDAIEQTDLLLIDEEGVPDVVWQELTQALNLSGEKQSKALTALSPAAKQCLYKVQVKCRKDGREGLSAGEQTDKANFIRYQCAAKGFDKYDYLVLSLEEAKKILRR